MSKYQEYYQRKQWELRNEAIAWQLHFIKGEVMYYSDLAEATAHFRKYGKRFGLLQEFSENAII